MEDYHSISELASLIVYDYPVMAIKQFAISYIYPERVDTMVGINVIQEPYLLTQIINGVVDFIYFLLTGEPLVRIQ